MLGRSLPELIFVRICIAALLYVPAYSTLYFLSIPLFYPNHSYRLPLPLETWLALEILFYLFIYLPQVRSLQRSAVHPTTYAFEERQRLYRRCTETIAEPEAYLVKWCNMAPVSEIKRENVKEFFAWAFLNKPDWTAEEDAELDGYADGMERLLGRKLEPGRGTAVPLRLTLDGIHMLHRPLVWYLIVSLVDTITHVRFLLSSFQFHRLPYSFTPSIFPPRIFHHLSRRLTPVPPITYYHRSHTSKTTLPILYIHGVGIGLYPYVSFLTSVNKISSADSQTGIIAIEILSICARLTAPSPELAPLIEKILTHHGWDRIVLVTHSYGSVVASGMLASQSLAPRIANMLLIDPVSFLLSSPDVAYNFTRRKPRAANEWQLYYFASTDPGVAYTLGRRFFWAECVLWREDLEGRGVTVVLSGKDLITDTNAVAEYLVGKVSGNNVGESDDEVENRDQGDGLVRARYQGRKWKGKGMEVLWFGDADHGQVFDDKEGMGEMRRVLRIYCQQGVKKRVKEVGNGTVRD